MVTIDGYSVANRDASTRIRGVHPSPNGDPSAMGQCFTALVGYMATSCRFYMMKTGSPIGNLIGRLYAMAGVFGTNGEPTGAALASSPTYPMASLTGSYQGITFTFVTPFKLTAAHYCVDVEALNATTLDADNYVRVGFDNSAPTHPGNHFLYENAAWKPEATADACFYVYGDPPLAVADGNLVARARLNNILLTKPKGRNTTPYNPLSPAIVKRPTFRVGLKRPKLQIGLNKPILQIKGR